MVTGAQLAGLRRTRALSAAVVAERAKTHTPNVYAIESGSRRPRIDTLDELAASLGARVILVDTDYRASARDVSAAIAQALEAKHPDAATSAYLQLANSLRASNPVAAYALSVDAPVHVTPEWDAALAGIVEWVLDEKNAPVPAWASKNSGLPGRRWSPWGEATDEDPLDVERVPEALRRRGVFVEDGELTGA